MKILNKFIYSTMALFLALSLSAKAEMAIGVTGAAHFLDGSGTETTRQSNEKNNGSHSEDVMVPEIFIETAADSGLVVGISYIPTRDVGSKSRSDANSEGDTGSYKASAELDNVIQFYTDIPVGSVMNNSVHLKLGIQHVTLATLESLNSGSSYPDDDLFGATIGLGTKGDLPYANMFYKAEVTYTDFETYDKTSVSGNKVSVDLEDVAAKLSIGYKF